MVLERTGQLRLQALIETGRPNSRIVPLVAKLSPAGRPPVSCPAHNGDMLGLGQFAQFTGKL
jgi:hypothetical protein